MAALYQLKDSVMRDQKTNVIQIVFVSTTHTKKTNKQKKKPTLVFLITYPATGNSGHVSSTLQGIRLPLVNIQMFVKYQLRFG